MKNLAATIKRHPFCKDMEAEHVRFLEPGAQFVSFAAGTIVAREGSESDRFYLVLSGKVALETQFQPGRLVTVQTLGAGETLGWSWLFPPHRWHFQARAVEPVEAIAWDTQELRARADANPRFGYEMARRLTRALTQCWQATHAQMLDFYVPQG
jgi:CRP-like cAMP-binding protein